MPHLPNDHELQTQIKPHNSLHTYALPRPLIHAGKIVIYDNTVQSQITFSIITYLIRTNFRGHLISQIWNTNISRALIFSISQKNHDKHGAFSFAKIDKRDLENCITLSFIFCGINKCCCCCCCLWNDHLNND